MEICMGKGWKGWVNGMGMFCFEKDSTVIVGKVQERS